MDDSGLQGGFDWENAEDVTALSEEDLRDALGALSEEERHLGYRRTIPPERLARVLLGDSPDEEPQ
jgi:hypothetical protein